MLNEKFKKMNIDEEDTGNFFVDDNINKNKMPETEEEMKEFIEQKKKEAQEYIEQNSANLAMFTGDSSLKYIPSNGFCYYPETNEIHLDLSFFIEKGYSSEQILWALYHEGSHFRDKRENPEAFLKNFENIRETGKKEISSILEKKYRDKFVKTHPEMMDNITKQRPIDKKKPEKGTMSSLDAVSYQKMHRLYNILDDIYVNDVVRNRAQKYASGDGAKQTENLYKKLFSKNDYTTIPRHLSFDLLLRGEMVSDEKHILHPDAQKAFKEFSFLGKDLQTIIQEELKYQKKGQSDPEKRYKLIKQTIEPIYLDLLKQDLEEVDPELPQKQKSGAGEDKGEQGDGGENDESGENGKNQDDKNKEGDGDYNPNDLDPFADQTPEIPGHPDSDENGQDIFDEINKDLGFINDAKERKDDKDMTPKERKEKNDKIKKDKFDKEFEINPEIRKLYDKRMKQIEPYRNEMMQFWKSLIYGRGKEYAVNHIPSTKGKFNTGRFIKDYAENEEKIRSGKAGEINSFDKKEFKEIPVNKPELIKVRVIGDISGSMSNGNRMKILQQSMLLLLSSIDNFNKYLDLSRQQNKSKLKADTEAWYYNHGSKKIKEFSNNKKIKQNQADIINIFKYLQKATGGNDEYLILKKINDSITKEEQKNNKLEKTLEIVFFITDGGMGKGGNHSIDEIAEQVTAMTKKGIIPVGFQIGSDSESEKQIFDKVFNENQKNSHGIFIGSQIKKLPKELIEQMKKLLKSVRI